MEEREGCTPGLAVPGLAIASLGFALSLFLYDLRYMASLVNVAEPGLAKSLGGFVYLTVAAALALVYRARPTFRIHRHTKACIAVALIQSTATVLTLGASAVELDGAQLVACDVVAQACNGILLACWAEVFCMVTARQTAFVFAFASVIFGTMSAITALLKGGSSNALIAAFPFLTAICLYWYRDHLAATGGGDAAAVCGFDRSLIPQSAPRLALTSALGFIAPLALYPLTYGYIQAAWLPMQDGGTTSMLIQLSRALGAVVAGGGMWLLVKVFWGRRKLVFYNMFALIIVCMTLYLMGIIPGGAPYPYVGLMNIAHKMTFLFVWLAPFLIPSSLPPLCWWCVAMGTYQVGKIASNLSLEFIGLEGCSILTLITTAALFGCFVACIVIDQGKPSFDHTEADPEPEAEPVDDRRPGGEALLSACASLSDEYGLSRRERDVLLLLAQGMVAKDIADTLVVSNATAKSHIRNLYQKTNVHSQAELMLLVMRNYS